MYRKEMNLRRFYLVLGQARILLRLLCLMTFEIENPFITLFYSGVQHGVFHNKQPSGLPENEKILPEYLKDLGYSTHAVGKVCFVIT